MATTAIGAELEDLGLVGAFSVSQHISQLQQSDEIRVIMEHVSADGAYAITKEAIADISAAITSPIAVKQLLETLEMAQAEASGEAEGKGEGGKADISAALFLSCLHVRGF